MRTRSYDITMHNRFVPVDGLASKNERAIFSASAYSVKCQAAMKNSEVLAVAALVLD
jgi:ribosomal protein S27E